MFRPCLRFRVPPQFDEGPEQGMSTPPASIPSLRILGIRGIPAAHGGFETFAERLALRLVKRGWKVTVYCQEEGRGGIHRDVWRGIHRIRIPVRARGAAGTVVFDWLAVADASRAGEPCLTLGYNTAIFCLRLRAAGVPNVINMDGIEWQRAKWGWAARLWLRLNERAGSVLGQRLVADHPQIARHLERFTPSSKITTIPYGADLVESSVSAQPVLDLGLQPGGYLTLIARAEPENSILEVVRSFSRTKRGVALAVLGRYDDANLYQRVVREAASTEVRFLGALYDQEVVRSLRAHALAHVHGHQVGGTNPSLVEALGAGNAVLAHDNRFNRWVAGDAGLYFDDEDSFDAGLRKLQSEPDVLRCLRENARGRFFESFEWDRVLDAYEELLHASALDIRRDTLG